MSRPNPLPSAASDHERHDRLLVAQLVAGDPLPPEQQAEAQRLIGSCGTCAALAADLPAVSRLVAQEPTPPRRRDFRLGPEQAAELRGNALTRFLRRLSLPGSRAFQPAAAGILSIGLLFVVAAYAWPDGGTITVQAEPNLIDWTSAAPASAPVDAAAEAPAALEFEPGADADVESDAVLEGAARAMDDSEFADTLAESQAGLSDGGTHQSQTEEGAPGAPEQGALQQKSLELEAAEEALGSAVDEGTGLRDGAPYAGEPDDRSARSLRPQSVAPTEAAPEESATVASGAVVAPDDDGPLELLVLLGLALALGGGGLLLLGWLARRARDPLAP
jgi:hypothetical protein